jgi:hypothetical protein
MKCPNPYRRSADIPRPGHDISGDPMIRLRFDGATCRACPTRRACTSAHAASRQLTVRPRAHHGAIQAARQQQETAAFNTQNALRAGVESSPPPGIRRCDLHRSLDIGLARTTPSAYPAYIDRTPDRHGGGIGPPGGGAGRAAGRPRSTSPALYRPIPAGRRRRSPRPAPASGGRPRASVGRGGARATLDGHLTRGGQGSGSRQTVCPPPPHTAPLPQQT